jgi:hypothetical protein
VGAWQPQTVGVWQPLATPNGGCLATLATPNGGCLATHQKGGKGWVSGNPPKGGKGWVSGNHGGDFRIELEFPEGSGGLLRRGVAGTLPPCHGGHCLRQCDPHDDQRMPGSRCSQGLGGRQRGREGDGDATSYYLIASPFPSRLSCGHAYPHRGRTILELPPTRRRDSSAAASPLQPRHRDRPYGRSSRKHSTGNSILAVTGHQPRPRITSPSPRGPGTGDIAVRHPGRPGRRSRRGSVTRVPAPTAPSPRMSRSSGMS